MCCLGTLAQTAPRQGHVLPGRPPSAQADPALVLVLVLGGLRRPTQIPILAKAKDGEFLRAKRISMLVSSFQVELF